MASRPALAWDWRDGTRYAALLGIERAAFAWEWLRRDEGYRREARAVLEDRAAPAAQALQRRDPRAWKWGLHAFEHPDLAAPRARPVWRRDFSPFVLAAEARPPGAAGDRFDLAEFSALATLVVAAEGAEHLLLSDGARSVRVDVTGGAARAGPVTFGYRLEGFESLEPPLLTLRRLLVLARTGRFSAALHPLDARACRWVALLRATDALAAGADQREIAEHLLGREAAEPRWRIEAPTLRSRAQRLVRQARAMAAGGYLRLLR